MEGHIKQMRLSALKQPRLGILAFVSFAVIAVCSLLPLKALATSTAIGYLTKDDGLVVGMAASLSKDSTNTEQLVERATLENKERFVGVITTRDASSITVANKDSSVYATTAGEVKALATDTNGNIKKGDFLVISPIDGLVALARPSDQNVIGTALEDFQIQDARVESIKDAGGQNKQANINSISIDVAPRSTKTSSTSATQV